MLSSSVHQHPQFQPIHANTVIPKSTMLKAKKRRKRRKKSQTNLTSNTKSCRPASNSHNSNATINPTTISAIRKSQKQPKMNLAKGSKQYFQHDNRLVHNTETILATSTVFTTTNYSSENDMLYAKVAKKFKPLNDATKQIVSKQKSKALLKQRQQQSSYSLRKLKVSGWSVAAQKSRNNHSKQNKQKSAALIQQQQRRRHNDCLCSCAHSHGAVNHSNATETAASVSHKNITSLCSNNSASNSTTSTTTTSNNNYLSCFNFNDTTTLPKLLGILQNSAPTTLLLETLINNAQILETKKIEQR